MSTVTTRADATVVRPWQQLVIIWALLATVPFWLPLLGGYTAIAARVLVMALAAMGLNLLLGYTGVLSFGHAAYFGLGAYGAGLTLKYVAASTPLAILAGTLLGGIAGTLFGLLLVRRRGVYFAMVTIAFGQVCFYIAYKWDDFTGGYDGLRGFVRAPLDFGLFKIDITGNGTLFYYFVLVVFGLAVGLQALILKSPFGRTMLAIRENERRARFLGLPVEKHIWLSFSISCFFTALAGTLYALLNNFADPLGLNYVMSGNIVMIAVMGGMRTFWGPLVGAVLFVMLSSCCRTMSRR
jgi:branched-chain amino acid transport system permease protein